MVHLTIHLAEEALLGGPVQYRWMYPIERYLGKLKSYVRNKCHPEGSIAEGYLAEECMSFCSQYLNEVETRCNRAPRNEDGQIIGAIEAFALEENTLQQTHQYVLFNSPCVTQFIQCLPDEMMCVIPSKHSPLAIRKRALVQAFSLQMQNSDLSKKITYWRHEIFPTSPTTT
ncbi:unnamed protein product [Victoria cruziana]